MRIVAILLGGVLLLAATALAAAWIVPPMLDWDRYRASIATLATERLGRQVTIAGPVSLTLLPAPVLTAAGVSVAGGADGIAIRADELRLRIGLPGLAAGRIDTQELVLRGADMHVPWPFRPLAVPDDAPAWFASASVRVEHGALTIGNLAFTDIQATLNTDSWTGSYTSAGTLRFSGRPWHFAARLTRTGGDGSAGLNVALDGQGPVQGIGGVLAGQLQRDGTFAGRIGGRGPDLSQLLAAPAVPFAADGRLSVAGGRAAVDDIAGDIGGSPARGAMVVRVAPALRMDATLIASRLDLDAWLPAVLHGGPALFPVGIDVTAEAAPLAGGTLRRLRGAVDLQDDAIAVRDLKAILPGEAALGATGQVLRRDGAPRFEGDATLTAPALRTTLAWLEGAGVAPASALPEAVLRRADLTARTVLEPGRITLSNLGGTIDDTGVSGTLGLRTGARPRLAAALDVDRLDLDQWQPDGGWPSPAAIPSRLDRIDADLRITAAKAVLAGAAFGPLAFDGAIEGGLVALRHLDLSAAGLHATASGSLGTGGRIADLRLEVQGPSATPLADLLPPSFGFLARARRFWSDPVALSVQASGPPEALAVKLAGELGDLRLEAQPVIDLTARRGAGTLTLRHPGARRLAGALGLSAAPSWFGDGSLSLLAKASLEVAGGRPVRVTADSFDLTAGGLRARGALTLDAADDTAPPLLSGKVVCAALRLPDISPRSTDPLGFAALRGWRAQVDLEAKQVLAGYVPVLEQATARVGLADGVLRLDGLTARFAGGTLTGTASLDAAADPPTVAVAASLSEAALDAPVFSGAFDGAASGPRLLDVGVDLASGRLDAALSLTASGYAPAALLATLGGELKLKASDGTLAGIALGGVTGTIPEAAVRTALAGGTTDFAGVDLVLQAKRGTLQVTEGRMTGPSGAATLSGSVDLPGDSARLRLTLLPAVADPPEIGLRLSGKLDQVQRVPELAALARWRAEQAGRDIPRSEPAAAIR